MRIALDCSAIPQQMAGAGVYSYALTNALLALDTPHDFVVFARPGLFEDAAAANGKTTVVPIAASSRARRLAWEQLSMPPLLRQHRIDVLHSTHHHTPVVRRVAAKRVVTMHDVTFLVLPERYPLVRRLYMSTLTRLAARVADRIIVPSQATREGVLARLGVEGDHVRVIPDAAGEQFTPSSADEVDRVRSAYGLQGDYVLSVGSLEPGKNRGSLLRAVAKLRDEGVDCTLAIAGQRGWRYEGDEVLTQQLGLGERVRFLGYVPSADLPPLYTGAALFAFPSLYEGFGLPILEAMGCGTPVVTSDVSSMPEAAGDAALLVDPLDVDAIAVALRRLLTDDPLRADLRERGLRRAAEFSWRRTAQETLAAYEELAAN